MSMGLFGISEVIGSLRKSGNDRVVHKIFMRELIPTRQDLARSLKPFMRGPASGRSSARCRARGPTLRPSWPTPPKKRAARNPERFGKGAIEGIAAPESANNAAADRLRANADTGHSRRCR
ncbi:tripartite tricarboxylate transporter permease [Arenibacterium halophilum]|uniref:tripartite tricarboxylate transporter permease n=1 Tax=Arenibacterium halophilum TaxID=2583821 RepID=UPI003CCC5F47